MRLIASVEALGFKCVPWSTPEHGTGHGKGGKRWHFATKNKRLTAWQDYVKSVAKPLMAKRSITLGPTMLNITFFKKATGDHKPGDLWIIPVEWSDEHEKYVKKGGSQPDLVNLLKGTEDTMESVIYGNDAQSCVIMTERRYGVLDGVVARVFELEPGDYPGIK